MNWEVVFKIITASAASVGIGGAIIFAMSSWLGKVWASRILEKEKHSFSAELEKTKRELDIFKEKTLRFQNDKILAYRSVIDVVARLLSTLDTHQMGRLKIEDAINRYDEFNEQRIRVYGYLAMLAPQSVMDAQDKLVDHLIRISNGIIPYEWKVVRSLAINLLNEVRVDIGIDKSKIAYNGEL